jgi:hypothetical protein
MDSSERKKEITYFSDELKYNIEELKEIDNKLQVFEEYFETEYGLKIKRRSTGPPFPIFMWGTKYNVEPISKNHPIWNLIRNISDKPRLRTGVYKRFSEVGLIYKLEKEDTEFLENLYSDFQSQVNDLLDVLFSELKNFPVSSRFTGKKELAEEYKKELEKQKNELVKKIQNIRKQIKKNVKRLEDINKNITVVTANS